MNKYIKACGNKGRLILVDAECFPWLNEFKWYIHWKGYASTLVNGKHRQISRLILQVNDKEKVVDHINGDTLDNRRCNLRVCSRKENNRNQKSKRTTVSGMKGVYWYAMHKKWQAHIRVDYKKIHLGYFNTREEAARAYNCAAIKFFGSFARLNIVD